MLYLTHQEFYPYQNIDYLSTDDDEEVFQIDVQPKRKYFETIEQKRQFIEEYTKKKKTELCKNFQLTGQCKYGDECSFAHGYKELQPKTHLHQKYKTKPCNRYFNDGFCPYGIRCQYIHDELKNIPKFEKYLNDSYKQKGMEPPIAQKFLKKDTRLDIQRFQKILQNLVQNGLIEIPSRSNFLQRLTQQSQ